MTVGIGLTFLNRDADRPQGRQRQHKRTLRHRLEPWEELSFFLTGYHPQIRLAGGDSSDSGDNSDSRDSTDRGDNSDSGD